jgi:hypothetical protein
VWCFANRSGEVVVGPLGKVDGAGDVAVVLHAGVEQRQDLKIDSGGVHLLQPDLAAVIEPPIGVDVVVPQPVSTTLSALTGSQA